ncbi:metal-dependent hydrolase [Campylobacter hyointestinalis]|uniref:Metal-dependent hydrolase n=1 Tax=Campylobacter hyointestinalis TaxID=198 RepID=A0A562X767_CAMHY|nr:metal-dependent hydrolase [Campylobacter hyointestinalis]ANE33850.1 putative membrane-bound metal-dependent hydrolase (DUF457 domain) [Campylobacter hyointestinalis subsp. lawsonii CCUG 27631]TWO18012.1 metal-dependent hydrolase [Campylobacter hyointestinalis]
MLGRSHRFTGLLAASVSLIPISYILKINGAPEILQNLADYHEAFLKSFLALGRDPKGMFAGYVILYVVASVWGAMLPNYDLHFARFYGDRKEERFRYHRQWTHSILLWTILTAIAVYTFYAGLNPLIWVFLIGLCVGGWSHLFGDMITGSVPWGFYGKYYDRFSRFGITIFLPRSIHPIFTDKFPKRLEKHSGIILFIAIIAAGYAIYANKTYAF